MRCNSSFGKSSNMSVVRFFFQVQTLHNEAEQVDVNTRYAIMTVFTYNILLKYMVLVQDKVR